jgi:hypothetical protein
MPMSASAGAGPVAGAAAVAAVLLHATAQMHRKNEASVNVM